MNYHLESALLKPDWSHWGGCDAFGRDLLFLLARASFVSVGVALSVALTVLLISVLFSFVNTLSPAPIRLFMGRTLDFFLSFPALLLALMWVSIHSPGWTTLLSALLIGQVPGFSKVLASRTDEILREEFVLSAYAIGRTRTGAFFFHVLPHLGEWIRVKFPPLIANLILAEAALTFLGAGAPIGSDTLGSLLAQGKDYLIEAPHILIVSGIPLFLLTLLTSRRQWVKSSKS